ncbi:MAG: transcriptional repressor [Lentisphaeraceae bacterium]|nr:transcriptional repressor [Lentisphaeraceae bacterium]
MNTHCKENLSSEEITILLKKAGLSSTSQRIGLCRYILCEAKHPTVEDIRNWAEKQGIKASLATIYNTLHALCNAKLIKDLRFPHLDKVIYDNNVSPHHHFLDEESGEIIDIDQKDFNFSSQLSDSFEVHDVDVLIRGKIKK